jgi:hypothetical protein
MKLTGRRKHSSGRFLIIREDRKNNSTCLNTPVCALLRISANSCKKAVLPLRRQRKGEEMPEQHNIEFKEIPQLAACY